jgi:hypothetical protein
LPGRHDVPGPAHRAGRIDRHHLAGDEPIEQVADRGEPLLDARRRELARASLDPRGDVHWLHGADRRHAGARAPGQEFIGGAGVGPARVRVADVGGEELEEAHASADCPGLSSLDIAPTEIETLLSAIHGPGLKDAIRGRLPAPPNPADRVAGASQA